MGRRNKPAPSQLLTAKQLKARLGLSLSWIFKRCMAPDARERHGITEELPRLYVGGALRFDPAEVDEWLRSQPRVRRKRNGKTIFSALADAQVEEITGGPR